MLVHCSIQPNKIGLHLGKYCLRGNSFLINKKRKRMRGREREKKKKYVCHQESHFMRRSMRTYSNSLFVSLEQTTSEEKSKAKKKEKQFD